MKISILTPTYNRAAFLEKLYKSICDNIVKDIQLEWLIMDDGSTDNTKQVIEEFERKDNLQIKYMYQKNQGKMAAINNLLHFATGDLIIECDSDDYFAKDAFAIIRNEYKKVDNLKDIYALCFLKYDSNGNNMGNLFKNNITTMFDLYFKEGETGEKALVFNSDIRKKYKYELERNERFITESRMYHKMDEKYRIICINTPILICEYQKDGYTKNILKQFKENPYGYFNYFKEILQHDFKGVKFNKRIYVIKHYILFSYLAKQKGTLKNIKEVKNKILFLLLYIPGRIKTRNKFIGHL